MSSLIVLLPTRQRLAAMPVLARGVLAHWWHRGDRLPDVAPGRDAALREHFIFSGTQVPAAALTRQHDANDAQNDLWLRADPAHARADMTTARLLAVSELGLTTDECEALLQPLKPLFGDAGFPIDAPTPQRWYLRCPPGTKLPKFSTPDDVLGDDLGEHLPPGNEGRRWRSLFNEAQIVLHQSAVNATRARRGQVEVNALWFWGAGQLPEWVKSGVTQMLSDDLVARLLAARAKANAGALDPSGWAGKKIVGDVMWDLATLRDPAQLEAWFARIHAALSAGIFAGAKLSFESGERVQVLRKQHWRFWRRVSVLPA
jgi:hypothetical protein